MHHGVLPFMRASAGYYSKAPIDAVAQFNADIELRSARSVILFPKTNNNFSLKHSCIHVASLNKKDEQICIVRYQSV